MLDADNDDEIDSQIECARFELHRLRAKNEKMSLRHGRDTADLYHRQNALSRKTVTMLEESKKNLGDIHIYAKVLKQVGKDTVPMMVMDLQALLCRALHQGGNLHQQHLILKSMCDGQIQMMQRLIARETEEATETEMQLLNQICSLDNEVRDTNEEYTHQVEATRNEICDLDTELASLEQDQRFSDACCCSQRTVLQEYSDSVDTDSLSSGEDSFANHYEMDFIISMLVRDTESSIDFTAGKKVHRKNPSMDSTYATLMTEESSSLHEYELDSDMGSNPIDVSSHHLSLLMT